MKILKSIVFKYYRFLTKIYIFYARYNGIQIGFGSMLYGRPSISRKPSSRIIIGNNVVLCSDSNFTALALNHRTKISTVRENAQINIGDSVGISGACIVSACEISIGSEVLIGANVLIVDNDFHPIVPQNRRHSDDIGMIKSAPVRVGKNVFIGGGSIILKGVVIGDDSVIAAGSVVVSGNYPTGTIIAGNPAKIVGSVYSK